MKDINVAFCINNAYIDKIAVVIVSILANNPENYFNFYIFSSDLTDESIKYLNRLHCKYKNFEVSKIEVPFDLFKSLKLNTDHISIETYYRYAIADLLPEVCKILYLDADIAVNKDISELYDTDISDYYLAGVEDLFLKLENYRTKVGLSTDDLYINAGVLLMNLQKLRQDSMCQKFIKATENLWGGIEYQDQDVINILCKGKIKQVGNIYNYARINVDIESGKMGKACIFHYTGINKPWKPRKIKRGYFIKFWRWKKYFGFDAVWKKYAKLANKIL